MAILIKSLAVCWVQHLISSLNVAFCEEGIIFAITPHIAIQFCSLQSHWAFHRLTLFLPGVLNPGAYLCSGFPSLGARVSFQTALFFHCVAALFRQLLCSF